MPRATIEVADIFRRRGPRYRAQNRLPSYQLRLMGAIEKCRTAALGGHVDRCSRCHYQRISYNSCRNRHCPKCQNLARRKWTEKRKSELLPVEYFHVVFTIPEQLNPLALQNKDVVYKILFDTSAATLQTIAADPQHLGAQIGFFSILHTWGQNLLHHPHIHCVAAGGGITPQGTWKSCQPGFFLSVRVLSRLFRRLFLEALTRAFHQQALQFHGSLSSLAETSAFQTLLAPLGDIDWVVYAKPPVGGPQQVLEYLGRYTHRVAISNNRLLGFDGDQVTFQYKNYRLHGQQKSRQMTLAAGEFIRRFLLHSLPPGFQRIRHYGLLSSQRKKVMLELCRSLLGSDLLPSAVQIQDVLRPLLEAVHRCPLCLAGQLVRTQTLAPVTGWNSS